MALTVAQSVDLVIFAQVNHGSRTNAVKILAFTIFGTTLSQYLRDRIEAYQKSNEFDAMKSCYKVIITTFSFWLLIA